MNLKKWFVYTMVFLTFSVLLAIGDVILAGLFALITFLFDPAEAVIVFKWVAFCLVMLELPLLPIYLYNVIIKERNEL